MRSPESGVRLAAFTTLGVGGPAKWCARAESADEVREVDAWARQHAEPMVVLGGGSNVLVADRGFDGLVLRIGMRGIWPAPDGDGMLLRAAAGEPWDAVVAWAVAHGLAGIECLSGIPGTVGGTPIQNVGAYGQEVANTIVSVTVFDRQAAAIQVLSKSDCDFAYRSSRFKTRDAGRFVICDVTFRLQPGAPTVTYPDLRRYLDAHARSTPTLDDARAAVLAVRRSKGMVLDAADHDTRSVGSFFTNPVVREDWVDEIGRRVSQRPPAYPVGPGWMKVPAAWLLEQAGFSRGYGTGAVGLSSKHPLAVTNRGGATASEVVAFAVDLKRRVADRFGVDLVPEPTFVGFEDDEQVRYLIAGTA